MANPIKIPAKIASITEHGEGVYTVVFAPEKRLPRFNPGQFLHLAIDEYDPCGGYWPDSRVFSIASGQGQSDISIVYSVKGKFTSRMREELSEGRQVWLKLPYGNFYIEHSAGENKDIVLIAGGTGISPYISYFEKIIAEPNSKKIHLIYGVRQSKHILFSELLEKCISKNNNFICDLYIENCQEKMPAFNGINTYTGIIPIENIWKTATQYSNPVFFLSGPPAMIKSFKKTLADKGLDDTRIRIDEWE